MQKVITLFLIIFSYRLWARPDRHLTDLKKESPHGLLTSDYGILSIKDLRINSCIAWPAPFQDPPLNFAFSYWQCFEKNQINMDCEVGGYDEYEKSRMAMLVILGKRSGGIHEFISRRPIPVSSCKAYLADWKRLTNNQAHVCLSGSEPKKEVRHNQIIWNWTFGRYKTKLGCDSFFQGECDNLDVCDP
jgi:hypothetical protein